MADSAKNFELVDYAGSSKKIMLKTSMSTNCEILSIRFDPDDNLLAVGNTNGTMQVYHMQTGNRRFSVNLSQEDNPTSCTCIRWRPVGINQDHSTITTGDGLGNIINWHGQLGKEISRINEKENQIMCMDYDSQGQLLATAGKDNTIRVYQDTNKMVEYKILGKGYQSESSHGNRIFSVKFLPEDSNVLISGSWDQNINIWDIREKKCVDSFIGGKIAGDSVDYKNGMILVGANTARDQIKIFDFRQRKLIREIDYEPGKRDNGAFIFGAQFSKLDDNFAVVSSGKNELRIFDSKREYLPMAGISKLTKGLYALDQGNVSPRIAVAGADGLIVIAATIAK